MTATNQKGTRVIALIGPYRSGKTSLMESLLAVTGSIAKKGTVAEFSASGDQNEEARKHQMGVDMNCFQLQFQGQDFVFLDCPGSVELLQQSYNALMVADAAVVVCEPQTDKTTALTPYLKYLDDRKIPHFIFINKMDSEAPNLQEILASFQEISTRPLVMRELPIREGKTVVGYVDLVSEKAYKYDLNKPSSLISIPSHLENEEKLARHKMLETLSEHDDHLLEELLEDIEPGEDEVRTTFAKELQQDLVVPVVFGGALADHGTRRLMHMLINEAPRLESTRNRAFSHLGAHNFINGSVLAEVFHTQFIPHRGKLSYCRIWNGSIDSSTQLNAESVKSVFQLTGSDLKPAAGSLSAGDIAILNKFESAETGKSLTSTPTQDYNRLYPVMPPLFALAVRTEKRTDELKLNEALMKMTQEDSSLVIEHNQETGDLILRGQGDVHLKIAMEKLQRKFNIRILASQPHIPYKETIQSATKIQGRYKKQTGGHGQFGDVHLEIKPMPRGSGFEFHDHITGGVIPKNYISSVEEGAIEALRQGMFGYPVVDIAVSLVDGSYHRVDSSDQAFKMAAMIAIREAIAKCEPLLLEPIMKVEVLVPSDIISAAQKLVTGHRGKISGFADKEGWNRWSTVSCQVPQAELHTFINELRSLSYGLGSFESYFDHFEPLPAKLTEQVALERKQQLESK